MALQDIPAYTGFDLPYVYGSPEYQAAMTPYLEQQLQAQAQRASNARGGFYSGPALADEQQAGSNLLYQMSQQGAQQALSEQQLMEQQAFQQQMQQQQLQAQADAAKAQGKTQMYAGALQGGLGSLGTLGGMYAMNRMGLMNRGGAGITDMSDPANVASEVYSENPNLMGAAGAQGGGAQSVSDVLGAGAQGPLTEAEAEGSLPSWSVPAASGDVVPAAGGDWMGAATEPLDPLTASGGDLAASGLAGLGGGLLGYQIGGGSKTSAPALAGGSLGGLAGLLGGAALGGPVGAFFGAGAGAGLGRQLGNWL